MPQPASRENSAWHACSQQEKRAYTLPALLMIMDGFGCAEASESNAISQAHTPTLDAIFSDCSSTRLHASGTYVGLPETQMGNSEVGHLNIGAGRIVPQELMRINHAIEDGSLFENDQIQRAFLHVSQNGSTLHLMGLLSNGGVHSSNAHLFALLDCARRAHVARVAIHAFMDGRDVSPTSGVTFMQELLDNIAHHDHDGTHVYVASMAGRYYAMDRDKRWERVKRAYDACALAEPLSSQTPIDVLQSSYERSVTDEFIEPVAFCDKGISSNDACIFFNFRPDRARQLTRAFVCNDFDGFDRSKDIFPLFICLTEYDATIPAPVAFPKQFPREVLADVISGAGLRQYHIAETEKYAHVTFFLNGGREEAKAGEERCLISSPKVATYDLAPSMSAVEVSKALADAIEGDKADVYIVNFANCDMVGHTGKLDATIKAVECVDSAIRRVLDALKKKHGVALLTADHGNADQMKQTDGSPMTAHTCALVPFSLINYSEKPFALKQDVGSLCNVSPTLLDIIGLRIPSEMTAESWLDVERS